MQYVISVANYNVQLMRNVGFFIFLSMRFTHFS